MSNTPKPVVTIRHAMIQAAIWRNENEQGVYYSVTFERVYKDGSNQWKSTGSFGRDDLLLVAKIADEANTAIFKLQDDERAKASAAKAANGAAASLNGKRGAGR